MRAHRLLRRLALLFSLTLGLALLAPALVASAQEPTDTSTPAGVTQKKEIPPGFEPVAGKAAVAESVSAPLMVILAYGAFFVLMFGYVIYVVRSQTELGKEMQDIAEKIRGLGLVTLPHIVYIPLILTAGFMAGWYVGSSAVRKEWDRAERRRRREEEEAT